MIRYADDFVILCRSMDVAKAALEVVENWVQVQELTLHHEDTCIVDARERGGFDFLGYHFERGYKFSSRKSVRKFRDSIRKKTRRSNGHSMEAIIDQINPILRGWFEYFKHSFHNIFKDHDGWIRMRLRS